MLTLEDAITHCLEVADGQTAQGKCPECAMEHRQLAEWLKELRDYRERMPYDNEGIAPKSITTAFQFGIVMGFGKKYDEMDKVMDEIKKAVIPQSKTGHWIVHPKGIYAHLVCDKCLSSAPYDCRTNYYPNCGAKMAEKQESEINYGRT